MILFRFIIIIYYVQEIKSGIFVNVELVAELQKHFKSQLVLIVDDKKHDFKFVKNLCRNTEIRGFVGVIDLSSNFEVLAKNLNIYNNVLIVFDQNAKIIENLIKV